MRKTVDDFLPFWVALVVVQAVDVAAFGLRVELETEADFVGLLFHGAVLLVVEADHSEHLVPGVRASGTHMDLIGR